MTSVDLTPLKATLKRFAQDHGPLTAVAPRTDWTDERIAALRRLWREGKSAARIAAELGGGLSRNAVIGKLHRLGLQRAKSPRPATPPPAKPPQKPRPANAEAKPKASVAAPPRRRDPVARMVAPAPVIETEPTASVREVDPTPADGVGIFELRGHHCRWMSGVGLEARYCGQKRVPDAKMWFCAVHQAAAVDQAARKRRAQRDRSVLRPALSGGEAL